MVSCTKGKCDFSERENLSEAPIQASTYKTQKSTPPLTPSFGNCIFACHLVLKHPLTYMILSFCVPKVLKNATKILNIGSQIKILHPNVIFTRAFDSNGDHHFHTQKKSIFFILKNMAT